MKAKRRLQEVEDTIPKSMQDFVKVIHQTKEQKDQKRNLG